MNKKVRELAAANGGGIVGEEYFPLDHNDYVETIEKITASGAEVVFNTIVPPGLTPFLVGLYNSGFTQRGGHIVCTYFDEKFLNLVPATHVEGLHGCLDYYQEVDDPFSRELLNQYNELYPGDAQFTAGSACTGLYRGIRLWEAAVREAGSLDQQDVIDALDHATIAAGPDINHYRRVDGRVQGPTCDWRLGLNARSLGNQRANTSRNPASTNGLGR